MSSQEGEATRIMIAIPARYGSTRLEGKPLQRIGNTTMISQVARRAVDLARSLAQASGGLVRDCAVVIATDDERIAREARGAGSHVVMTDARLASGTDRVCAACEALADSASLRDGDLVVNIQGDEPFFSQKDVGSLVNAMLARPEVPMGTLAFSNGSLVEFLRSSVVKVIRKANGDAAYFSRAPIPWPRATWGASGENPWTGPESQTLVATQDTVRFLQHVGIYAYRFGALKTFAHKLPGSALEQTEGLEQLRAIEAGWDILVADATEAPSGIDTPEDLARAHLRLESTHV